MRVIKKTKYENQNIQPFIPHSNADGKLDVTPRKKSILIYYAMKNNN